MKQVFKDCSKCEHYLPVTKGLFECARNFLPECCPRIPPTFYGNLLLSRDIFPEIIYILLHRKEQPRTLYWTPNLTDMHRDSARYADESSAV